MKAPDWKFIGSTLDHLGDRIAQQVLAHGQSVEEARSKGFRLDRCSEEARRKFFADHEASKKLSEIGSSVNLLGKWVERVSASKGQRVAAPGVASALIRELKVALDGMKSQSGGLRMQLENVVMFLEQIQEFLSENFASEVLGNLALSSTAHEGDAIKRKPRDPQLGDQAAHATVSSAAKSAGQKSTDDVVNELIKQSDRRAALLGSRTMQGFVGAINKEARKKGFA